MCTQVGGEANASSTYKGIPTARTIPPVSFATLVRLSHHSRSPLKCMASLLADTNRHGSGTLLRRICLSVKKLRYPGAGAFGLPDALSFAAPANAHAARGNF